MAEFGRGIKAGIVAGIISGIISMVFSIIQYSALWDAVASYYEGLSGTGGFFTGMAEVSLIAMIPGLAIGAIIGGIIGGIIFGLIYAAVYNSLPGSTSIMKGIVLSLIFWLIFTVALGYASASMIGIGMTFYGISLVFGLISSLIWGFLLGTFWDKFAPKPAAGA